MDATLLVDHHHHPAGRGVVVRALLTLTGQQALGVNRPPLGLALVLDRSGSMAGEPLEAARNAAARVVERLHPTDVVSAVAFDSAVRVVAEPGPGGAHTTLPARIRALDAGGSTNLSGGWLRGRQHMADIADTLSPVAGSTRRIVLLTDGHANHGITDRDQLVALAREARKAGISTTTVGFGAGYDDDLLRAMADAGGGNAWYIERPDQAADVFAEELGALLSVTAQGVRVTLTLADGVALLAAHSTWPAESVAGGHRFDLGDLYSAEPKPVLVELFVPFETAVGKAEPLATFVVSADVLTVGGGVEHRSFTLPLATSLEAPGLLEPDVERAILLARVASAREQAAASQREGDAESAARCMTHVAGEIAESPLQRDPAFQGELLAQQHDLEQLAAQYRERTFSEQDAKYQMQRSYNTRRGKGQYDGRLNRGQ